MVFGDGRMQRRLLGTAWKRELASAPPDPPTHHTHQALLRKVGPPTSRAALVGVVGVVGVKREERFFFPYVAGGNGR
jgi:hypothetical protein